MKPLIISGNRTVEDVLREHLKEQLDAAARPPRTGRNPSPPGTPPAPSPGIVPAVTSLADYIKLENISCVDAEGHEFERYGELYVAKDIVRNPDNSQISKTPYQWAVYFEPQGLFLPSFALSCAIVAQLYHRRNEPDLNTVLMHYKDKGDGYGWHAQNTIVDYENARIIHYPSYADFPANGGANAVNLAPRERKELHFVKSQKRTRLLQGSVADSLQDCVLKAGLKNPVIARFVRNYTGLEDPSVLVDIGTYFQKTTRIWFPSSVEQCQETRAAWLGCNVDDFGLVAGDNLGYTGAARGVRLGSP